MTSDASNLAKTSSLYFPSEHATDAAVYCRGLPARISSRWAFRDFLIVLSSVFKPLSAILVLVWTGVTYAMA